MHVKAGLVGSGRVEAVAQVPCALWRGVEALDEALTLLPGWAREEALHAVTMTGELCDAFQDRREGVAALSEWAGRRLRGPVRIYAGRSGFCEPQAAPTLAMEVASANWYATAELVARRATNALLVDIGSTTSDLIPVAQGRPRARGYTDAERLRTRELVYTGVVRTPVAVLAAEIEFRGETTGLTAEWFATTADVYRRLGRLAPEADQQEAADGRGKSTEETEVRLARMVGCDRTDGTSQDWQRLAAAFAAAQIEHLERAAARVLAAVPLPAEAPVVGCGVGRFVAADLAARIERPYRDLADLIAPGAGGAWISYCAPAVAVALLSVGSTAQVQSP